jgi:PKD repeat protein
MRPIRSLYPWCALILLSAAVGCGKDSNGPENSSPTADFASSCTDLSCSFTNLSSDADGQLASYTWDFGDGQAASAQNPSHLFAAGGQFSVKLTVADNLGAQAQRTKTVSVTLPLSGAPAAAFSVNCSSLDCTFQDQSTDANGTVTAWAWEFGDGAVSDVQNPPVHHYSATARTIYTAQLTVTDDQGLTSTRSAEITVSPAAELQCEDAAGTGNFVACDLVLGGDASVTVKLQGRSCDAHGDTFKITAPVAETLFDDGCYSPAVGSLFQLDGGTVFAAGTHLKAEVISGAINQLMAPALHVSGAYPTWTLAFDDGVGGAGEPDFNDLIITVTANPVP